MQLLMQLMPFTQALRRKKFFAAFRCPLTIGFFVFERVLKPVPHFDISQKIRAFIIKALVRRIRSFASFCRTVARVLQRQRTGDNQNFRHAMVLPTRQQQARNLGIEWKLGQFAACRCKLTRIINRTQLCQQLIAI